MKKCLKYSTVLIVLLLVQVGCKSKKAVVANERAPRVIIKNNKPIPTVVTPVVTPPKVDQPVVTTPATSNETYKDVVSNYIATYGKIAKQEMALYGIPASITLAQGILESGAGKGELTRKAKNHFGIKCHSGWTGERSYHDDDELQECFRKYADPKNSFRDHSLFLSERSRYRSLFDLDKDDYKGWAKGLRKAGYATDPKYPNKLISIIERYNLKSYDDEVLRSSGRGSVVSNTPNTPKTTNKTHTVIKGDTLYSIARKHGITVEQLRAINGLTSNDISIGQTLSL